MNFVLDASVGIKWFYPENLSKEAYVIFDREPAFEVPELFYIEIDSILTKRVRIGELEADKAIEIAKTVRDIALMTTEDKVLNSIAFGIATAYFISLYDAVYLALAVVKDKKMITADKRLIGAIENTPLESYANYLGNIET